jgi:DNA-binding GntR family transcriptional regulator
LRSMGRNGKEMLLFTEKEPILDITNINEKVYGLIRKRIIHLEYPPGYQINVRKLQDELHVSNSPIKDALFRLAGEGMVEITSRRGTFVKEVTERDIYEIAEVRRILETGAIDLIAGRITEEEIEELEALYKETLIGKSEFDYDLYMEKDKDFHLGIMGLTGNQRLLDIYRQMNAHLQIVRFRYARQAKKKLPWTDRDHENILKALKERDGERAKRAMEEHLLRARDTFLKGAKAL